MAFSTGNFSSFASLKTSVETELQANGWTLTSGILSKGSIYLKLTASTSQLLLEAGTGASAGALTGADPNGVKILDFTGNPMSFPATYDLHVLSSPDEVYLVVNYNADRYQQLSWGASVIEQIGGSGIWYSGSFYGTAPSAQSGVVYTQARDSAVGFGFGTNSQGCGIFCERTDQGSGTTRIHNGLDATGWRGVGLGSTSLIGAASVVAGLLQALPSNYNQNTVLLPVLATQRRTSNGQTIVADLAHARLCRNDNQLAGEVVDYGGDSWKVYPFHRKNADARNGVEWPTGANHTGTFAYAVRYTGP